LIQGSKGKGGGGGGYRAPVEAENTLQSTQWVTIVDAVSEGPIVGLIDDAQGIALNYTPLETVDHVLTYRDVSYQVLTGLPDQDPLDGIDGVEAEQNVNVEVTHDFPKGSGTGSGSISRQITNLNCTDVRITLSVQGLYHQITDNQSKAGDIEPTDISYTITITNKYGSTIGSCTKTKHDKTNASAQWYEEFKLDKNGPWNITITKDTADSVQSNLKNDLYWSSFTEIVGYKMMYPNTAVVAVKGSAESFGSSIPTRNYHIKGLKIEVPSNYDPETRTYTGIWNGTFKIAWTDNPAWIFRDIIENDRYGVRKFFSPDQINEELVDKWGLYEIAQYCDELVPNGDNGEEPRFTFNGVISGAGEAVKVVQSIASVFYGMSFWASGIVFATADRLQDPIKTISQVNTIGGKITYSTASNQERHTVARITWYDPEDYSRPRIESVYDWDLYKLYGERPINKVAYGCTSRGQAHRLGLWTLLTEQEQWTATAEVGLDCYDLMPNDWVRVADPILMGVRYSGRIKSVNGTTVKLDAPVNLSQNETYTITIIAEDNTEMVRTITSRGNSDTITLQSTLNKNVVPNAVWTISGSDAAPRTFMIQTITKNDDNTGFVLQMKEVDPTKYAKLNNEFVLEPVPNRRINRGSINAPVNLQVVQNNYSANGGIYTSLTFSWTNASPESAEYEPIYITPSGSTIRLAAQRNYSIQVPNASTGQYTFKVRARASDGRTSQWAEKVFTATGTTTEPKPPTDFTATGGFRSAVLNWTIPNDAYIGYFEIYQLQVPPDPSEDIVENATLIAKIYASSFTTASNLDCSALYHYWIRSANVNGNSFSAFVGPAAAMTDALQPPDIPEGLIQTPHLADEIITRPKIDDVINTHIDAEQIYNSVNAENIAINAVDEFNERIVTDGRFADVSEEIKTSVDDINGSIAELNVKIQSQFDNAAAQITENRQTIAKNDYATAKRIDTVQAQVNTNTAGISSNQTAIATLTEVEAEDKQTLLTQIGANTSAIQSTNTALSNLSSSTASSIQTLITNVNNNTAAIQSTNTSLSNLSSSTASSIQTLTAKTNNNAAAIQTNADAISDLDENKASASSVSTLTTKVNNNTAAIQTNANAISDLNTNKASASSVSTLTTKVNNNTAAIQTNATAISNLDQNKASASSVNTLTTKVNNNTSAIQTNATAISTLDGECEAQYTLKVNANKKIAGFGLWSSTTASEFAILADKFKVVGNNNTSYPVFSVDTQTGAVGIVGNLFVLGAKNAGSGWITGDYINANSVITLNNGSIVIDGTHGTIKVLDPNNTSSGTYTYISDGYVSQYVNGTMMRSLNAVETGQCTNNTWCTLTGKYSQQPKIIVSPKNLQCFNASYNTQNQAFNCEVTNVEQTATNTWRFKPLAQLVIASGQDFITTPSSVSTATTNSQTSATGNTGTVSTGNNCNKIEATVTFACYFWDISKYYKSSIKVRIAYKLTSASSWSYGAWSSAYTLGREDSKTITLSQSVTSGNYNVRIEYSATRGSAYTPTAAAVAQEVNVGSVKCTRGTATVLATGTLNYIAVGR